MTIIDLIKGGSLPAVISEVSKCENVSEQIIIDGIINGTIVIPKNKNRKLSRVNAIGKNLTVKVNANIGTSPANTSIENERKKLDMAIRAGADAVMDLSIGGDLKGIRKMVIENSPVCIGTVPIYQVSSETVKKGKKIYDFDSSHIFSVIEEQAEEGVDFMTVHCGITKKTLGLLEASGRLMGIVSRGGAILEKWIKSTGKENPLFDDFDRLLDIAKRYDIVLSLGDGLRPGCLNDAMDSAQIGELEVLGELVLRARKAGVQVIVEGPGHMPLDKIKPHILQAKSIIHDAPFYLLGPLVTDVAAGYDHITGAIGGALAAWAGADFLCYVTPVEHLRLPDPEDVYDGVIASKIAGHAADIAKGHPGAKDWDKRFSMLRKDLNWEKQEQLALAPDKFKKEREKHKLKKGDVCTMCGEFCAIK